MTATTISDTERREVAERLRSVAREVDRGGFSETIKHVKLAVFEDLDLYRPNGTLDRLADLVEPSCDRDALLALEDEMFEDATGLALISQLEKNEELQDLQSTMAKALMDYARRIREALGVES